MSLVASGAVVVSAGWWLMVELSRLRAVTCSVLQAHPDRAEYATVGDDGTLRVWDAKSRKQLRMKELGCIARAVTYSPDGNYIAIGFGGRVGGAMTEEQGSSSHMDGSYMVLRSSDLVVSHQARDAQGWILDIKFSPDGQVRGVCVCVCAWRVCVLGDVAVAALLAGGYLGGTCVVVSCVYLFNWRG